MLLYYGYSKSSLLPFYPCHFSLEPCQFLHSVWILDSCLGPFISISLYRAVMFSSNFFLNHLVQASFLNVSLPCPCLHFLCKAAASFQNSLPFLCAKQVSWHHSNTSLQLYFWEIFQEDQVPDSQAHEAQYKWCVYFSGPLIKLPPRNQTSSHWTMGAKLQWS